MGHQGHGGGSEGRGVARQHETRDGQAGRSRTRTPRESGERGRRISSRRKNGASRRRHRPRTHRAATALSPNHARNGERTQHDHVSAAADRFVQRVFEEVIATANLHAGFGSLVKRLGMSGLTRISRIFTDFNSC